jgi:hypothetical protein
MAHSINMQLEYKKNTNYKYNDFYLQFMKKNITYWNKQNNYI